MLVYNKYLLFNMHDMNIKVFTYFNLCVTLYIMTQMDLFFLGFLCLVMQMQRQ